MDNLNKRIWMCILHYEWMWICSPVWPIVLVAAIHRHWSLASLQVKHYWMICTKYNLFRSNKIVYITALNSLCLFSETFQLRVWQAVCVPTDLSHFHPILICLRCWMVHRRRQSITEKSNSRYQTDMFREIFRDNIGESLRTQADWYDQIEQIDFPGPRSGLTESRNLTKGKGLSSLQYNTKWHTFFGNNQILLSNFEMTILPQFSVKIAIPWI